MPSVHGSGASDGSLDGRAADPAPTEIAAIAHRLAAGRASVSFDEIVELVRQAHERTADARVQTYRVVLTERRVRDQLRLLDRTGTSRDPSVEPPDLRESRSSADATGLAECTQMAG